MITARSRLIVALFVTSTALSGGLGAPGRAKTAKLTPQDIVAGNLASIGTAEARAAGRNRTVGGTAEMVSHLGAHGALSGKGIILSEGHNIRLGMNFPAPEYPGDQIAFDGDKVMVGQIKPGIRSPLSSFIYRFDGLVKEGLLGGTLTVAWALLDVPGRQPKLDYTGLKKVEGKQLHELKYKPKLSVGDVTITLYFEPETFRHVRSQYRLVRPAEASSSTGAAVLGDTIYTITEDFSDFKAVDGLTLPLAYKLRMAIEGPSAFLTDWTFSVSQIVHNQAIDPKSFSLQ
jgi:hypothetical protein